MATDLSKLSDEELMALSKPPSLADMSDEELLALADNPDNEATPRTFGGDVLTSAESMGQGATLSLGDEIGAGVNAGIDQLGQFLGIDLGQGESGNETFDQSFGRRLTSSRGRQNTFNEEAPVASFINRVAGGAPLTALTGGGGLLPMVGKETILGGVEGFGSSEGDGIVDTAIGAGLSLLPTAIFSGLGRPARDVSKAIGQIAARAEKKAGKRLITRAQEFGGKTQRGFEASSETIPFLSSSAPIKDNFQTQLNRTASESIGEEATDKLTVDVLSNARENIGREFDSAISDGVSDMTGFITLPDKLQTIKDTAKTRIGDFGEKGAKTIKQVADRVNQVVHDAIPAPDKLGIMPFPDIKEIQTIRSELLDLSRDARKTGNTPLANTYGKLSKAMDETIESSLSLEKVKVWRKANEKWKNLKALESGEHVVNTTTGDVSGKQLFSSLSKQAGGSRKLPDNDLNDLARLSRIPSVGDSGTATRQVISQILGTTLGGGGLAALTGGIPALGIGASTRLLGEVFQREPANAIKLLGISARGLDLGAKDQLNLGL